MGLNQGPSGFCVLFMSPQHIYLVYYSTVLKHVLVAKLVHSAKHVAFSVLLSALVQLLAAGSWETRDGKSDDKK